MSVLLLSMLGSRSTQLRRSAGSTSVRRPRLTARNAPDLIASYRTVLPARATAHASVTVYAKGVSIILAIRGRDGPGNRVRAFAGAGGLIMISATINHIGGIKFLSVEYPP
jgi:hypothetical protein